MADAGIIYIMEIKLKRVYEPAAASDGYRVLVDRLWPRGIKKTALQIDEWCKTIAPSPELRTWFHQDMDRFTEFAARYQAELSASDEPGLMLDRAAGRGLTLVYASKEPKRNHAIVLQAYLRALYGK